MRRAAPLLPRAPSAYTFTDLTWSLPVFIIPFGKKKLEINNYLFKYFTKEFFDYLNLYNNIQIDLLTCNLNSIEFKNEVYYDNELFEILKYF